MDLVFFFLKGVAGAREALCLRFHQILEDSHAEDALLLQRQANGAYFCLADRVIQELSPSLAAFVGRCTAGQPESTATIVAALDDVPWDAR